MIWTGSDDGYVQVTRDNGVSWQNVTPAGLKECLINAIEVSPHDKATAYIATTRYKFNDHTPGLYKTTNYGKTWTNISSGIPTNAFTRVVREDDVRKDLLFAGTELGLFISWNGGQAWSPFQLNLPITPITDLRIHHGDLIASTSGRAFWILDDIGLVRQFKQDTTSYTFFQPKPAILINSSSDLDRPSADFNGSGKLQGINPASGVVMYYQLPDTSSGDIMSLEIKDAAGNLVRKFSSKADSTFIAWDGGPEADPTIPKKKGLNRFVWNMRYPTISGIPGTYIESSFDGHKASPGKYTAELKTGNKSMMTNFEILPNPLYDTDAKHYEEYHTLMQTMETEVNRMHITINDMAARRELLESIISALPNETKFEAIKKEGQALISRMKTWDEDMIQRKSKAYDDVENFPNKFTANYLFMINQTESEIPKVNQASLNLMKELDQQWSVFKIRAEQIIDKDLPSINKNLWDSGIGPIWKKVPTEIQKPRP
ncbi:MAG: hypothetical protein ABIR66_10620 [Saprospiraceae bacterium]